MTRVVFGSNVLVGAALFSESVPGRVIVDLITYKARVKGLSQPVIPCHPRESGEKAGIHFNRKSLDSRFLPAFARMTGNDGLSRDLCPGFHQPRTAGRALRVIRKGVE